MKTLPDVLTIQQLADFLGQDRADQYRVIGAGKIPGAFRAGKRWYVGRDSYLKAITGGRKKPMPKVPGLPWV